LYIFHVISLPVRGKKSASVNDPAILDDGEDENISRWRSLP